MGVQGLWDLLEPAGKPIPLETLENKTFAIDVSIWLNQAVKGIRDQDGGTVANAHLIGLFHRLCKLLFYKIRPIFVFDGKAPKLKLETLRKRRQARSNILEKSDAARAKILENFIKRNAVASQLQRQTFAVNKTLDNGKEGLIQLIQQRRGLGKSSSEPKDIFDLPPLPENNVGLGASSQDYSSDDEDDWKVDAMAQFDVSDIHSLDVTSQQFQSLPTEIQFELLAELKERRKQSSWNKMSEMPRKADDFSGFQMKRLVKRSQVQKKLNEVGKQLGQDANEGLDASLFVGDKQGMRNNLKKEMKKVASSRDGSHIMYLSGLSESRNTSSDTDKEQERITSSLMNSSTEDEDDPMDILEPSSQSKISNRMGGGNFHHDKNASSSSSKRSTEKSPVHIQISMTPNEDEFMSSSDESEDDMFADVFSNEKDIENLDKILENAKHRNSVQEPSEPTGIEKSDNCPEKSDVTSPPNSFTPQTSKQVSFLQNAKALAENNQMHDVYSQIVKQSQTNSRRTSFDNVEDVHNDNLGAQIVDSMKSSKQIWLKKASEWAEKKVIPTSTKGTSKPEEERVTTSLSKNVITNEKRKQDSVIEWERKQLVSEMKQNERENRLLNIKNQSLKTEPSNDVPANPTTAAICKNTDDELIDSLGVAQFERSEIEHKIMEEQGWLEKDTSSQGNNPSIDNKGETNLPASSNTEKTTNSVVYGDSVEGFVASRKYQVIEASKESSKNELGDDAENIAMGSLDQSIYEKLANDEDAPSEILTENELIDLQQKLAKEQQMIVAQQKKAERFAATITDQMYQECQQLLQLFGVPWIVSPGEAEAQCAFLDDSGLANGIITDDSDVWVFGGKNVFKNFFNRDRYCESFSLNEIAKHFGLTREKMIQVAMLTGSDYTEGILDIGPVTSMEVLAEFPGEGIEPLIQFAQWSKEVNGISKVEDGKHIKSTKTRERFKRFQLPPNFPRQEVYDAYINPTIDTSTEKFSWAIPNFVAVRDYTSEKFGWSKGKTDQILKPVIRKMTSIGKNAEFQSRIDNYFQSERMSLPKKGSKLESSKRVKQAIDKVLKKDNAEISVSECNEPKSKAKVSKSKGKKQKNDNLLNEAEKSSNQLTKTVPHPQVEIKTELNAKELAKQKAIEIYKKSQDLKRPKAKSAPKPACKVKKPKMKTDKRKVLKSHNLSESEEEN